MNINIPDDHIPKYNVSPKDLQKANEAIKKMSAEKRDDIIIKDDMLIQKEKDYKAIWDAFLNQEEKEFKQKMRYGKEDIERIGVEDFIDIMDWKSQEDVRRWRTDILHVLPCLHCEDNFAIFEHPAICKDCKGKYDLDKYFEDYNKVEVIKPGASYALLLNFTFNKSVREKYLKGENQDA